ncbi:MAG TPA: LLM class flavin-dependent oxidoreductase [Solirubrobacteraceae bacterium]
MHIGIGLPAAVPGTDMTQIGRWAAAAEEAGFASVGVIDRLVYDNLDPLTALAAAAASTERIALTTTVVNVCWRANPVLLAKQAASVQRLSGGHAELRRLEQAGCDEVVLVPCAGDLTQVGLVAGALRDDEDRRAERDAPHQPAQHAFAGAHAAK